jgi:hypothetical protein
MKHATHRAVTNGATIDHLIAFIQNLLVETNPSSEDIQLLPVSGFIDRSAGSQA